MSDVVIRAEGLGKRYRIGRRESHYRTLRESLANAAMSPLRRLAAVARGEPLRRKPDRIWALRDVDFEVRRGEVLGIIGSNGAGKSTLLKILARITEPTTGRVELRGRVGSLLEVGTGFHPELTGRENIYLNGAILGMTRNEVKTRLDEIVDFSGVRQFIETPVKRYSSGMQLRLAFAVAAHLDPEIMIVDEVLAVGDAAFQAKCLKKMESVSKQEGRTILFVSHNMGVVRSLCTRALLLEAGRVIGDGNVDEQISRYLGAVGKIESTVDLSVRKDRTGDGRARILNSKINTGGDGTVATAICGQQIVVDVSYEASVLGGRPRWAVSLFNERGIKICHLDSEDQGSELPSVAQRGVVSVVLKRPPLPPGVYTGDVRLIIDGIVADYLQRAFSFRVEPGDFFGTGHATPSHGELVYFDHRWESRSKGAR